MTVRAFEQDARPGTGPAGSCDPSAGALVDGRDGLLFAVRCAWEGGGGALDGVRDRFGVTQVEFGAVVSGAAGELVAGAVVGAQQVVTVAAVGAVGAVAGLEQVLSAAAVEAVVAEERDQGVGVPVAAEPVIAVAADQGLDIGADVVAGAIVAWSTVVGQGIEAERDGFVAEVFGAVTAGAAGEHVAALLTD